jgi:transcriptional regulator of acetoin/glycerol metabolism
MHVGSVPRALITLTQVQAAVARALLGALSTSRWPGNVRFARKAVIRQLLALSTAYIVQQGGINRESKWHFVTLAPRDIGQI